MAKDRAMARRKLEKELVVKTRRHEVGRSTNYNWQRGLQVLKRWQQQQCHGQKLDESCPFRKIRVP